MSAAEHTPMRRRSVCLEEKMDNGNPGPLAKTTHRSAAWSVAHLPEEAEGARRRATPRLRGGVAKRRVGRSLCVSGPLPGPNRLCTRWSPTAVVDVPTLNQIRAGAERR